MRVKMRWRFAVVLFSLVCSVLSDDEADLAPSLTIMARSTVYNAGENKAIFCKVKNIIEPIEWYRNGNKVALQSNKNTRVFIEKITQEKEELLAPLIIHRVEVSDSGNWTCKAGDFSESIDILVGEKVTIAVRNETVDGEEGKSARLSCKAVGKPEPTVMWYKDNAPLPDDPEKYHNLADHTLVIKKLTHNDPGTYVCKVRQKVLSHYTDKTVHLTVQHKPILYNSHTQEIYKGKSFRTVEVYAILNETKNITCNAIANPPPKYRWAERRDSFDTPIEDEETVISSEDGRSSVLVLRMRDESNTGEYVCTATNPRGKESIIFHVSLGTKPDPPDFVHLVTANVTELIFNVTCSLCNMEPAEDDKSPDPEHLPVLGYYFELVQSKENFAADWLAEEKIARDVYISTPGDTLFTVDSLVKNTPYHVRVRTVNAAGHSDWFEVPGTARTANHAFRMSASILILIIGLLLY